MITELNSKLIELKMKQKCKCVNHVRHEIEIHS